MEEKIRKTPRRLVINIDEDLHYEIKKRALFRNVTMSNWVLVAIQERIDEERKRE